LGKVPTMAIGPTGRGGKGNATAPASNASKSNVTPPIAVIVKLAPGSTVMPTVDGLRAPDEAVKRNPASS